NAISDAVDNAISDAVDNAISDAVDGAVRSAIYDGVRDKKLNWHNWIGGQFWVGGWYWGTAYADFLINECNLSLNKDIMERFNCYKKINESVNYIWCNKNFVMVCARPTKINRNIQGQLHSVTEKSIEYPDGWGLYSFNGITLSEELFVSLCN